MDKLDKLLEFALKLTSEACNVPEEKYQQNIYGVDGFHSYTLHRQKEFQIQLFICPPKFLIPEHVHPNIDSYEVYLDGDVAFSVDGYWLDPDRDCCYQRVNHDTTHGAAFGDAGGKFMSVQIWLNDVEPSCVGADYDGGGVTEKHTELGITEESHIEYKPPTWKDCASKSRNPPRFCINPTLPHLGWKFHDM